MDKEKILKMSRKENKNMDFPELEAALQASSAAGRVGAAVCILLSVLFRIFTGAYILSPWVIYFSMIATQAIVRYAKFKRKTELILSCLYCAMLALCLVFFILRLTEFRR